MPGPATGLGLESLLNRAGSQIRYGMSPEEYKKWAAEMLASGQVPEPYRANPNVADRYLGTRAATEKGMLPESAAWVGNEIALGDHFLSPYERQLTKDAGRAGATVTPAQGGQDGIMAMLKRLLSAQGGQ